jgi:hypothetical protein
MNMIIHNAETTLGRGMGACALNENGLLEFVSDIRLEGTSRFAPASYFRTGMTIGGRTIGWVGDNFTKHFVSVDEANVHPTRWSIWRLAKSTDDFGIVAALGGADKFASTVCYLFQAMALGSATPLLQNGYANIVYSRSTVDWALWALRVVVDGDQWGIEACPTSRRNSWRVGRYVCSAN